MHPVDILLVEDGAYDADLTLRAIKRMKLQVKVVHVEDGIEALNFLSLNNIGQDKKAKNYPRLILTDLKLPKLDGIQLLNAIRTDKDSESVPVVIFTSSAEYKDILASYQAGANAFVVKPLAYHEYCQFVFRIISFWIKVNHGPGNI